MPPKPRKVLLALGSVLLICALICAVIGCRGQAGSRIWLNVSYGLLLVINSLILFMEYRFGNTPAPNPLIGLFPKPQLQKDDTL